MRRRPLLKLLLLVSTVTLQSNCRMPAANGQIFPPAVVLSDTAQCYSCMSRLYEAVWPSLRFLYKVPKNFTDACDDVTKFPGTVPVVHCPTICVSMAEQPNIAGVRVRGHIRGCMSELLINGFNQTIVSWYRWMHRDSCRLYRKKELFKLPGEYVDDSMIEVCTCYADNCNGSSPASSVASLLFSVIILLLRYLVLL